MGTSVSPCCEALGLREAGVGEGGVRGPAGVGQRWDLRGQGRLIGVLRETM